MLIAAISDTHIPAREHDLPSVVVEQLRNVDLILHAGDFTTPATLNYLMTMAPTEAVYGNVDDSFLKAMLPKTRVVNAGRFRIGLVHGDGAGSSTLGRAYKAFDNVDCIVFGHSHSPYNQMHDSVLMVNPGSPTDKRRQPRASFALLRIEDKITAEIVYL